MVKTDLRERHGGHQYYCMVIKGRGKEEVEQLIILSYDTNLGERGTVTSEFSPDCLKTRFPCEKVQLKTQFLQ